MLMYKRLDTSTEAFNTVHLKSSGGATLCCHLLVGYRFQMLLRGDSLSVLFTVRHSGLYISSCHDTLERTHNLCFKGFPESSPSVSTSRLADSYLVCPSSDSRSGSRKGKTFDVFDGIGFFFSPFYSLISGELTEQVSCQAALTRLTRHAS